MTVQLEDEPVSEDLYECSRVLNQKRAFRRQRAANHRQEQQGDNYNYSNNDLRNVINIGRDAHNVIISRKKESEEIEAYSHSSNYRIPAHISGSFNKRKLASNARHGMSRGQHHAEATIGGDKINKTLLHKSFMHPKSSHTVLECNTLCTALGAPLVNETLPKI